MVSSWLFNDRLSTITESMEHISCTEFSICSASPEISRILWNPQFLYRVGRSTFLVPVMSQLNPPHFLPSNYIFKAPIHV